MNDEHFNCDDLLSLDGDAVIGDDLREAVLSSTVRLMRRRQMVRRTLTFAAMALFYLAGIGSAALWFASGNATAENRVPRVEKKDEPKNESHVEIPEKPKNDKPSLPRKIKVKQSRFAALRELGDRYLNEKHDPEAATRCYRMALRYGTPQERKIAATEGTWLLRALTEDFSLTNKPEQDHENDRQQT